DARLDPRGAGVGLSRGEAQGGPCGGEITAAADNSAIGVVAGAVELERAVVRDVAGEGAGRAAVADPERAAQDGGAAAKGVYAGKYLGALAGLGEAEVCIGAAHVAGEHVGFSGGDIEGERAAGGVEAVDFTDTLDAGQRLVAAG